MLIQKAHTVLICDGLITLHRLYPALEGQADPGPDICGSVAEWEAVLWPMFNAHPFRDFWNGLDVWGIHMDSPELETQTRNRIANLQDYDTTAGGFQVAAGLYWNKDRLELGFFPDGWKAEDAPQFRPIPAAARARALQTLSHEAGHFHADLSGYQKVQTLIQREITRLFDALSPAQAQNLAERWAECYRAFFGGPGCRGFFSDGKPYPETANPPLFMLMRSAYWLQAWLASVDFSDLQAFGDRIQWQTWRLEPGYWPWDPPRRVKDAIYCLDRNWRRWRWDGVGAWVPA